MSDTNIIGLSCLDGSTDPPTDLLRDGARQLIQSTVEDELATFLAQFIEQITATGHRIVVRNGYHPKCSIQTGIGPLTVKNPKVRSKAGDPVTFHSAFVPPYARQSRSIEAALPCFT